MLSQWVDNYTTPEHRGRVTLATQERFSDPEGHVLRESAAQAKERLRVEELRVSVPWQGQLAMDGNEAGAWAEMLRVVALAHFRCDAEAVRMRAVCKNWRMLWTVAEGKFAVEIGVERSRACVRATHNRSSGRSSREDAEWGARLAVYARAERAKTQYMVDKWQRKEGWHIPDIAEADRLIFQPQIGTFGGICPLAPEELWR